MESNLQSFSHSQWLINVQATFRHSLAWQSVTSWNSAELRRNYRRLGYDTIAHAHNETAPRTAPAERQIKASIVKEHLLSITCIVTLVRATSF